MGSEGWVERGDTEGVGREGWVEGVGRGGG